MAAAKKPTVDLNAQEKAQRLAQAQQAISEGRIPFVHPAVTDPRAIGHAMGMASRKGGGLPKYQEQVAGGAPPHMPALEQPHQDGMTMAQQAESTYGADMAASQRQAMQGHVQQGNSIISPDGMPLGSAPAPTGANPNMPPGSSGLLPTDLLPQEATADPTYQRGAGSMMAQSQPHLAMKYGVVRNRQLIPPQMLQGPQMGAPNDFRQHMRRPSEQTAQDLQQVAAMQQQRQPQPAELNPPPGLPRTDEEAEAQAAQGPGGASANVGRSPAPSVLLDDEEAREANSKEAMKSMESLDIDVLREEMIKDILKNPGQREEVEKRCKELDLDELIMKNKVSQRVPIVPKTETSKGFEPTFESMEGTVEMMLKQMLVEESKSVSVTDTYLLDKYAVMTTAAGLLAINGTPVPSMYDEKGDFNKDMFWKKYTWVLKKPIHMLASLGIHYAWFEARVRKLFKVSAVKNG